MDNNKRERITYGDMLEQAIYREAVKQMWIDRLKIVFLIVSAVCMIKWLFL